MKALSENTIDILFNLLLIAVIVSALYFVGDFVYKRYWPKESAKTRALIEKYEARLKKKPNDIEVRTRLSTVYMSVERYDDAANEFKMVLKVNDRYGPARVGLGIAYMKNGKDEKALKEFKKEIEVASKGSQAKIDRFLEQAYYFSGMIYLEKESNKQAISSFDKALEISAVSSDTYFHLGEAYQASGKKTKAKEAYKKVLELDPGYKKAKKTLEDLNG
ncbi:MAG: tetratricopeptide repeat protein [Actinobacteria bacterium]|nr:MAG: tetratricopeptide repeat protein [Actinomycetota bacterium]